jgi:hypothetical protein
MMGFDEQHRPAISHRLAISYIKYDEAGRNQLCLARLEAGRLATRKATHRR